MSAGHQHQVVSYQEAETLIRRRAVVYVNDCFCRAPARDGKAKRDYCGHPVRTCMGFQAPGEADFEWPGGVPMEVDEIPQERALQMMAEWKDAGLFFRSMEDENWLCLCCPCGCGWFRDENGQFQQDPCDRGHFIEKTDAGSCTACGECVPVCAWGARLVDARQLAVDAAICYGCGACEYACPEHAITMVPRQGANANVKLAISSAKWPSPLCIANR